MQTSNRFHSATSVVLPKTDLNVSNICLGTGGIGSSSVGEEAYDILNTFVELGGTFIDTAHNYGDWVPNIGKSASERTIGAWLKESGQRSSITLATKGGHFYFDTPNEPRLSKHDLEDDLNGSLEALQTDYIDLYWLHRDDRGRPVEDILATLNSFVAAGKIRYFGASNWKTHRLAEAQTYAASAGIDAFVADQPLWNAAILAGPPYGDPTTAWMDDERHLFHLDAGLATVPYQSQAYGLFQRMFEGTLDQMNSGFRGFYKPVETEARYKRMLEIMEQTGFTITQVTLSFLISQPFVTVPIVGCRTPAQVADSMTASTAKLTPEQLGYLQNSLPEAKVRSPLELPNET
jgi:aryl-alcohol dehydrogenase-like predicted oxidoreductase